MTKTYECPATNGEIKMTDSKVDKQREAFEKWAKQYGFDVSRWTSGKYKSNPVGYAFDAWRVAQADKLEFARKVAEEYATQLVFAVINKNPVDIDAIIAKVEQAQ